MTSYDDVAFSDALDSILDQLEQGDAVGAREATGIVFATYGSRLPAEALYHLAEAQTEADPDTIRLHVIQARDMLTEKAA